MWALRVPSVSVAALWSVLAVAGRPVVVLDQVAWRPPRVGAPRHATVARRGGTLCRRRGDPLTQLRLQQGSESSSICSKGIPRNSCLSPAQEQTPVLSASHWRTVACSRALKCPASWSKRKKETVKLTFFASTHSFPTCQVSQAIMFLFMQHFVHDSSLAPHVCLLQAPTLCFSVQCADWKIASN